MTSRIQRWGNSLAIRIPKALAQEIELRENADVDLKVQDGSLVITPPIKKRYTLDELLEKVTPDNVHPEVDWGPSVGREVW